MPGDRKRVPAMPELSLVTRIALPVLGWLLVALGIAGLVLPGLQGILTIALGMAILSLTSKTMLRLLRWTFRPWPDGWRRVLEQRRKVLRWLTRSDVAPTDDEEVLELDLGPGVRGPDEPADSGGAGG